ncbi:hypothetical protein B0A55_06268 [Friedmanniomyces simplex]|uniref:Uncharacterized protein n=1 Tax=Friedmanniomyces simplex TaxID=329884 RepID=A0A4U0XP73_9PEZI|nr:hypothetical protein B0A55_06268 [Friedmanniomyces simplex]
MCCRFCRKTRKDPLGELRRFTTKILSLFFHFLLAQRRGTLGHASTLQTYWNTLCLMRKRETGLYIIQPHVKDAMVGLRLLHLVQPLQLVLTGRQVRQQLADEFELETEKQAKPIVRAEDEYALLKTLWSSPSLTLDHERLRVQLALIAQLAGITGNRPGALLALRYGDLKVTLLRDPSGTDVPKVLLEFKFRKTQTRNTFPIPEKCTDSCLPICPQIVLLGLMFADNAFESQHPTGPERLFRLHVLRHLHQLELPIKKSLRTVPVFRAVEQTAHGYGISPTTEATGGWLRQQFKRWCEATRLELPLRPYGFRRGNGEALDSSAHISAAQRNIILQHGNSGVFERNHLSRYITQDTQAVYRGLEPQTAVIRLASGMMRSINVRQPTALTSAQLSEVDLNPELQLLLRTRRDLAVRIRAAHGTVKNAMGTKLYSTLQSTHKEHHKRQKALRRTHLKGIKSRFRKEQALANIERQLDGTSSNQVDGKDLETENLAKRSLDRLSGERRLAYTTLFSASAEGPAEDWQRRSAAINAVTALCKRREPCGSKACLARQADVD